MTNDEFLRQQYNLLKERLTDSSVGWQDIIDLRNEHLQESKHKDIVRKGSKLFYEYLSAGWIKDPDEELENIPNDHNDISYQGDVNAKLFQIDKKLNDLQKERYKLQTEKLEINRWRREEARDEMLMEQIDRAIADLAKKSPIIFWDLHKDNLPNDNKQYCLLFGDEHFGADFTIEDVNGKTINAYNPQIFEQRMNKLLEDTIAIIKKEDITELNVFNLGDFTDGILRISQLKRLAFGVVDGTIYYSEFISQWLARLSEYVKVNFQMTDGNHSELRLLDGKKGSFASENMGKVVRAFVKMRLKDIPTFHMIENPTGYIYANICGYNCIGIHGEDKNLQTTLDNFSRIYNMPVSYLFAGHLHHSKMEEIGKNCEVINVPSIIGADPYAISLRKMSDPAAKLLVFQENYGKVCEYTIKLN